MENKVLRIGMIGKMRSGKDTAGYYLEQTKAFRQFAFGTGIKRVTQLLYPELDLRTKPRKLYQDVGQKLREIDPMIWINLLNVDLKKWNRSAVICGDTPHTVITDVRQMNEVEFLKEQGYVFIKVECDEEIRLQRIKDSGDDFTEEDLNHETEVSIDTLPYDYLVTNNGTVEELTKQIEKIYWEELAK
ncbi:hypothetical protein FT641_27010 [Bacillus paranthracis]|uniref:deoxynucleotide monophosphate kinase family protein n=1 Tax=Bacillus paranthracis TaxID=2026186 RepID=UPI00187A9ABB|nr:hypothetical protein [Bacillus paranthracis]MBE7117303.1 hypothetical protein [Bacillus paranthracis]MBE7134917.1 hypothetical protein [Bacillus paranthracis]MBE7156326.1 hypothetical protein [Bacillus paranthracis]